MSDASLEAINYVLLWEGENFTVVLGDLGGPTKYGITLRTYQAYYPASTVENLKNLSRQEAIDFYLKAFWLKAPYLSITCKDVVKYLFDMHVNMGLRASIKCAQRASWSLAISESKVSDDGLCGKDTLSLLNKYGDNLLPSLRSERANYYKILTIKDPSQLKFLPGWLNRTYGL